jgi:hypothetical protein
MRQMMTGVMELPESNTIPIKKTRVVIYDDNPHIVSNP